MFEALDPQTGSEAALVARAVIAHHAAAECFRPAVLPEVSLALQSRLIAQAAAVSRLSSQLVMALQLRALRDALIEAGASDARAQRAAEELAGYEREFAGIRGDMQQGFAKVDQQFVKVDQQFTKVDQQFAVVRGDINLLRWMAGANFALTLAVFVKLFIH